MRLCVCARPGTISDRESRGPGSQASWRHLPRKGREGGGARAELPPAELPMPSISRHTTRRTWLHCASVAGNGKPNGTVLANEQPTIIETSECCRILGKCLIGPTSGRNDREQLSLRGRHTAGVLSALLPQTSHAGLELPCSPFPSAVHFWFVHVPCEENRAGMTSSRCVRSRPGLSALLALKHRHLHCNAGRRIYKPAWSG